MSDAATPYRDSTVTLPDGRLIGFAEFGANGCERLGVRRFDDLALAIQRHAVPEPGSARQQPVDRLLTEDVAEPLRALDLEVALRVAARLTDSTANLMVHVRRCLRAHISLH